MGCGSGVTCWRRLREGQEQVCGSAFTKRCWQNSTPPTRSIGAGPRSTPHTCVPLGARARWTARLRHRGKRQRHLPLCFVGGCRTASAGQRRTTEAKTGERLWRSHHLRKSPPGDASSQNQGQSRQAERSTWLWPCRRRWVVERTLSWLHQYRRLRVRYERRADIHEAFPDDRLLSELLQAASGGGSL